jgi:hypothetical protein
MPTISASSSSRARLGESHRLPAIEREVRCGLYHGMATKARVLISRTKMPVTFALNNFELAAIVLDPWAFLEAVGNHLAIFMQALRDPENTTLRQAFEKFFDSKRGGPAATLPPNFFSQATSSF